MIKLQQYLNNIVRQLKRLCNISDTTCKIQQKSNTDVNDFAQWSNRTLGWEDNLDYMVEGVSWYCNLPYARIKNIRPLCGH